MKTFKHKSIVLFTDLSVELKRLSDSEVGKLLKAAIEKANGSNDTMEQLISDDNALLAATAERLNNSISENLDRFDLSTARKGYKKYTKVSNAPKGFEAWVKATYTPEDAARILKYAECDDDDDGEPLLPDADQIAQTPPDATETPVKPRSTVTNKQTAPAVKAPTDPNKADLKAFGAEVGISLNGDQLSRLGQYVIVFGAEGVDIVKLAMRIAADAGKPNYKYVSSIINSWRSQNIKTVAAAEAESKQKPTETTTVQRYTGKIL